MTDPVRPVTAPSATAPSATAPSATVPTLRGEVPVADLGRTLAHEHVFVLTAEVQQAYPQLFDDDHEVPAAVTKLRALRQQGITTIFDPTVVGLGRDIARVARVNAEVDLHIVCATGLYTYDALPMFFSQRGPHTLLGGEDPLVELMVGDLTQGIQGTGVRAAFLKCAIDYRGLTRGVERVLRAVAEAHARTGAPVMVHTNVHKDGGPLALDVLTEAGVDPTRVMLGHSGDSTDLDYLMALADRGAILGMDRFGLEMLLPFEQRVDTVVALCERGYADRMVLSQDASCHIDWFPPGVIPQLQPRWNYLHVVDEVLPALTERGVTDAQIAQLLVEVPARFLTG